jgi:hypothetical protein
MSFVPLHIAGAELGDMGEATSTTGSPSMESTNVRTGAYAFKLSSDGDIINFTSAGQRQVTFGLYITTMPTGQIKLFGDATGWHLRLNSDGTIDLYANTVLLDEGTATLSTGQYYDICIIMYGGHFYTYIDEVADGDGNATSGTIDLIFYNDVQSGNAAVYCVDDILATSLTPASGDCVSARKIYIAKPASGTPTYDGEWLISPSTDAYAAVDEVPVNITDRWVGQDENIKQTTHLQNCVADIGLASGDTIDAIKAWVHQYDDGGSDYYFIWREQSTDTNELIGSVGKAYTWNESDIHEDCPSDADAWTQAVFDAMEVGAWQNDKKDMWVYALHVMVVVEPAATGTDYPINSTANISLSASATDSKTFTRNSTSTIDLLASVTKALTFTRSSSSTIDLLASATTSFGKIILAAANMSLSASATRTLASVRTAASNLTATASATLAKGKSITSTASMTVASSFTLAKGFVRAAVANITGSASATRTVNWNKKTGSRVPLSWN